MSLDSIPGSMKSTRACLLCSLIKTFDQFESNGCDNCDEILHMKNNRDNVFECTSQTFQGMVALMSPEDSWVAKRQKINRFTRGVYALSVSGRLPPRFIKIMKDRGLHYRPRDNSTN